ncbi:MAG: hypothetical protein KBD83_06460 [Gammaproteobacteria bacterium]|nr:hypothetical protein [Gammaproteobacteria bacterium]
MTQEYDKRFQDCVDELMVLQRDAEKITQELKSNYQYAQKKTQETADDLSKKMTQVERSLSNINVASGNIAGYMAQCEKHADRTRKVFMGMLVACVVIVAGTLWWADNLKINLAEDIKEFNDLESIFKNEPALERIKGQDYVRIIEDSETSLYDQNERTMDGRYAKVWHKK